MTYNILVTKITLVQLTNYSFIGGQWTYNIEQVVWFTILLYLYLYYHMLHVYVQSAKILLLPPKYEIIMVPSNHSFFQYCDSNIGLFSITHCKVITLNPLCILFVISSLLLFDCFLSKVIALPTIAIVVAFCRS